MEDSPEPTKAKRHIHPVVDEQIIFHWPEAQLLLKKFGVNLGGNRATQESFGPNTSEFFSLNTLEEK